jgi:hypothetical protein
MHLQQDKTAANSFVAVLHQHQLGWAAWQHKYIEHLPCGLALMLQLMLEIVFRADKCRGCLTAPTSAEGMQE